MTFLRDTQGAPRWTLRALGREIEVDARKVTAGGNVDISADIGVGMPLAPTDLDDFCWAWLSFRGAVREEWER